jgi:hypothetical protein
VLAGIDHQKNCSRNDQTYAESDRDRSMPLARGKWSARRRQIDHRRIAFGDKLDRLYEPKNEMRRSFGNERDYAHDKPSAALHLQITQEFQGWDKDRYRPWGHLEPLLHAQRRRRGRRPRPLPNQPVRSRLALSESRTSSSCHGDRNPFDLGQRADPGAWP